MNSSKRSRLSVIGVAVAAAVSVYAGSSLAAPKAPRLESGPDAEVTHDGLYRVEKSVMDAAWAKPGLDLTGYTKLMLGSAGVSFRKLDPVNEFEARSETTFPVQEENKEELRQILREAFTERLAELERYEIVSEPGPDVLMLVAGVIDVVSRIPPDVNSARFGRGGVYLTSVGEATLVIELRDSQSEEVLVRAADRRAAESAFAFEVNDVTAWSEVRRLAQYWANLMVRRLEEIERI